MREPMNGSVKEPISVLLVDDDDSFAGALGEELGHSRHLVRRAVSAEEARGLLLDEAYDVILLDLRLPGMDGIEALKVFHDVRPSSQVVVLTAFGSLNRAVEAMRAGAYDFLAKPSPLDQIETVIRKAYERRRILLENEALRQEMVRVRRFDGLVGESPAMRAVMDLVAKVAPTDSTVLLAGESGVGKEVVAKEIHANSERAARPFIVVDCGSLHENLLLSELFGHEKGAYTGAASRKHGLFEVADGGTILLDEIGEIAPPMQVKLLRVLETSSFRRVGGTANIKVNVRVLAATNRDLRAMVSQGTFREDLYYRLNVISVVIPPLRERREDISPLVQHFLERGSRGARPPRTISSEAMAALVAYSWPGNIRELQNLIERAVILSENREILPSDLPGTILARDDVWKVQEGSRFFSLDEVEKNYIATLLNLCHGHRARVAQIMGISERTLYRKIRQHKLRMA